MISTRYSKVHQLHLLTAVPRSRTLPHTKTQWSATQGHTRAWRLPTPQGKGSSGTHPSFMWNVKPGPYNNSLTHTQNQALLPEPAHILLGPDSTLPQCFSWLHPQKGSDPSFTPRGAGSGENDSWDHGTAVQPLCLWGEPQRWLQNHLCGSWTHCCRQNSIFHSAASHCPFCSIFSRDYELMFTSLLGFKVSSLQISIMMGRETEKHELKIWRTKRWRKRFYSIFQIAKALVHCLWRKMLAPLCTGAGLGLEGAGTFLPHWKAEGWGRCSKQGQLWHRPCPAKVWKSSMERARLLSLHYHCLPCRAPTAVILRSTAVRYVSLALSS